MGQALMGWALMAPPGALMGRSLMGQALMGWALAASPGPSWAGRLWALWALCLKKLKLKVGLFLNNLHSSKQHPGVH